MRLVDRAKGNSFAIAVDGQGRRVVDEGEMHPVLEKARGRQLEGDLRGGGIAAGPERRHAATVRLGFPAAFRIILLAGEQAEVSGPGLTAHPAGNREHAVMVQVVGTGHREIGQVGLRRRARTADWRVGAIVADAFGCRALRRRIIGRPMPRRVPADAVRLTHVPDAGIAVVPGPGRI